MFLDDTILTGKTQVEYENNLLEVLTRLSDAGLTLKEANRKFGMTEVQYLEYHLGFELWLGTSGRSNSACNELSCSDMYEQIEVLPGNAHVLQPVPAELEYCAGATSRTVEERCGVGLDDGA